MNYVFDITPADDPKDGEVLIRLTKEEHLQEGSGVRIELYGLGSGIIVVNKNSAFVTPENFASGNYVRVYDLDISSMTPLFGFFLDERAFKVLSVDEEGGQTQQYGGPGVLSYLGRVILDSVNYIGGASSAPRVDGKWHWYNDQYGDILKRLIDEAQDPDRPNYDTLIPAVTYDFGSSDDSGGNAWSSFTGEYTLDIGINYLDAVQKLIDGGIFVKMDPDFLLQAFQSGGYGIDRTSSAYASGKVRFTSFFTEGYQANIVEDLDRSSRPGLPATRALVKGDSEVPSTMVHRTMAGDITREIFVTVEGTHAVQVLQAAGDKELGLREDSGDTPVFRHRPGLDDANGLYSPFPPTFGNRNLLLPRLYFTNDTAGVPEPGVDGAWDTNQVGGGSGVASQLKTTRDTGATVSADNWSGLPRNILILQLAYVLTGTVDFTGGSVRAQYLVKAKSGIGIGAQEYQSQMVIRLFDSGGSLKGTLLPAHNPGSRDSNQWSNEGDGGPSPPHRNAKFPAGSQWVDAFGAPLDSLTGVSGDRIYVELGGRQFSGDQGPAAGFGFSSNSAHSDLPENDETQINSGYAWIEFWGPETAEAPSGTYWVGDTVTIDTGTGVGDYQNESKRVYAINVHLDENGWWPTPELGPLEDEDGSLGGGIGSPPKGGGGGSAASTGAPVMATLTQLLTNKSGGSVVRGDVVIIDPANDESFKTTTTEGETVMVGVALEDINSNAKGDVATHGFVELVNTTASVTRGNYGKTSTSAKLAVEATDREEGIFVQFLTGGTTPAGFLFGIPDAATGGGGGATGGAFADDIPGDNSEDEFDIDHDLDTTDVLVELWDTSGSDPVLVPHDDANFPIVEATDNNTIHLTFTTPPAPGEYRVVVLSGGGGGGTPSTPDIIQYKYSGSSQVNSHTIIMPNAQVSPRLLFYACEGSQTISSVTQTGGTWTKLANYTINSNNHEVWLGTGSTSNNIVVSMSGTQWSHVAVIEVAGITGTISAASNLGTAGYGEFLSPTAKKVWVIQYRGRSGGSGSVPFVQTDHPVKPRLVGPPSREAGVWVFVDPVPGYRAIVGVGAGNNLSWLNLEIV